MFLIQLVLGKPAMEMEGYLSLQAHHIVSSQYGRERLVNKKFTNKLIGAIYDFLSIIFYHRQPNTWRETSSPFLFFSPFHFHSLLPLCNPT
jgi:hypothetical protein